MHRDGSFEVIEEAAEGELFAEDYIRYAPRRIDLEPNTPQTIRVMIRKPADLEEGEYRSHLQFAAVPEDAGSNSIESQGDDGNGISIQLTPIYGVTIPVIVRHGALSADASISGLKLSPLAGGKARLSFTLSRKGSKSLYGDFSVHINGEKRVLQERRGIAVYTPNTRRDISIDLTAAVLAKLRGKELEIRFTDRSSQGGAIIASSTLAM